MHRIPATKAGKRLNIFSLFPSSTTTIQHRTYCPTPLEPLKPVAVQLWEQEQAKKLGLPPPQSSYVEKDELFDDPLYSPIPKVNTGLLGQLPKPLHWPKDDQAKKSLQETGLPGSHLDLPFDDPNSSPIGNYPRMKATYGLLKDPYTYWDVQGRRNYGELIHDQDLFTDVWGIGPEQSPAFGLKLLFQAVAFVSLVATGIWVWNPEKHSFRAEKEYPFNGLRVELGGDPSNPSDNYLSQLKHDV